MTAATDRKEYMKAYRAANRDKLAAKARERWADRGRTPQHVLDRNKADAWFYRKRNKDKIKEQRWWRERKKVLTLEQKERRREINRAAQARYYERHKDEILKAAKVRRVEDAVAREAEFARRQSRVAAGIRRAAQLAMEKREARTRSIEAIKVAGMRGFNRLADAMAEAHNEIWGIDGAAGSGSSPV